MAKSELENSLKNKCSNRNNLTIEKEEKNRREYETKQEVQKKKLFGNVQQQLSAEENLLQECV